MFLSNALVFITINSIINLEIRIKCKIKRKQNKGIYHLQIYDKSRLDYRKAWMTQIR